MDTKTYIERFGGDWEIVETIRIPDADETVDIAQSSGNNCTIQAYLYKNVVEIRAKDQKRNQTLFGKWDAFTEDDAVAGVLLTLRTNGV